MTSGRAGVALLAVLVLGVAACNRPDTLPAPPATSTSPAPAPPNERAAGSLSGADAAALATMNDRLRNYIDLHTSVKSSLPSLPAQATPAQIHEHQRALEKLLQATRATAKPGDLFTPEAQPVIRRLLATMFGGPEGQQLKSSIMDEAPVGVKVAVNGRYPDTVPLSTMPPRVLQMLPRLPEGLEYRFVGDSLIILDVHAHVIADYVENALPKSGAP